MATLQPDELAILGPRWRAEKKFRAIGIEEEHIRMAFDRENEGREIVAEASQTYPRLFSWQALQG